VIAQNRLDFDVVYIAGEKIASETTTKSSVPAICPEPCILIYDLVSAGSGRITCSLRRSIQARSIPTPRVVFLRSASSDASHSSDPEQACRAKIYGTTNLTHLSSHPHHIESTSSPLAPNAVHPHGISVSKVNNSLIWKRGRWAPCTSLRFPL
jgi:hypothetical protein